MKLGSLEGLPEKKDYKPLPFIIIPEGHELNDLMKHNNEIGFNTCKLEYDSLEIPVLSPEDLKKLESLLVCICQILDSPMDMPMSDWDKEKRLELGQWARVLYDLRNNK